MQRILKLAALGLVCVVTAACANRTPPMTLTDVQYMKAEDPAFGRDIYGARRAAGEALPTVRGNQVIQIRTYQPITDADGDTENVEFSGATCTVASDGVEATVNSPGALHVPLYGFQTPQMSVSCEKEGFVKGVAVLPTINMTQQENLQMGANAGLIGLIVMAGVNAASDETNDKYMYQFGPVLMKAATAAAPSG